MRKSTVGAVALAIVAAVSTPLANAAASTITSVSPASYYTSFPDSGRGGYQTQPGTFIDGGARIILRTLPNPSVTASASYSELEGDVSYQVVVNGPVGGPNVPIRVVGRATLAATTNASAEAVVNVDSNYQSAHFQLSAGIGTNSSSISSPFDLVVLATPNYETRVALGLSLGANDMGSSASGYVDPIVSIDPSFAAIDPNYLKDYSLSFSPGVGNSVDAVPEPAALALLGVGALALVAARRRA